MMIIITAKKIHIRFCISHCGSWIQEDSSLFQALGQWGRSKKRAGRTSGQGNRTESHFCSNHIVACENSRPSSLPVRVAFREKDAGSEEGRLFSQANHIGSDIPIYCLKRLRLVPVIISKLDAVSRALNLGNYSSRTS